jgi:hypothetical protein
MFSVPLNARKVVFGMLFVCLHVHLASAVQRDRFHSYSVFKCLSHYMLVSGEYEHSSCKTRGLPDGPKETQLDFS